MHAALGSEGPEARAALPGTRGWICSGVRSQAALSPHRRRLGVQSCQLPEIASSHPRQLMAGKLLRGARKPRGCPTLRLPGESTVSQLLPGSAGDRSAVRNYSPRTGSTPEEAFLLLSMSSKRGRVPGPVCAVCWVTPVVSDSVTPWTVYSPPGSPVRGIFQSRTLEWASISFSRSS